MGEVWRGRHKDGAEVALKFLFATERDQAAVESFEREVRAVAALNHPSIVRVYDTGRAEGRPWLAMEFVAGRSLERWTKPGPWGAIHRILSRVLEGLSHAHARDEIHRDIKPANILISLDGSQLDEVKLTDFGLAFALRDPVAERKISGTPHFMAPEQFTASWRDFGPWTDLYSLGVVAWYLAAGRVPFDPEEREGMDAVRWLADAHLTTPLPPLPGNVRTPAALEAWIARCTAKSPSSRFPDAPSALDALNDLAAAPRRALPWRPPPQNSRWMSGVGRGLYEVRDVPLVGRDAELNALDEALREVEASGAPQVRLLRGPAGVGKTHLARWVCRRAAELGRAAVLHAHSGRDAGPGHGLWAMLVDTLRCGGLDLAIEREAQICTVVGDADRWLLQALTVMTADRRSEHPIGDLQQRLAAVRGLLGKLAATRGRPLLVWCDDVQWGIDTIALAGHLLKAATIDPVPVLMILTAQDEALVEAPVARALLTELSGLESVRRIDLTALDDAGHDLLVGRLLGFSPALERAIADHTRGNPLFAVQLVGDLVARDQLELAADGFSMRRGVELELPDDLHAVWDEKVRRATGAAGGGREALEIAAVLGLAVEEREWQRVCANASVVVPEGLVGELLDARLARQARHGFEFTHQILRNSLLRGANERGRLANHHALCAACLAPAARWDVSVRERVGSHLCAAGQVVEGVQQLIHAADAHYDAGNIAGSLAIMDRAEHALGDADFDLTVRLTTLRVRCIIHRKEEGLVEQTIDRLGELLDSRDVDPTLRRRAILAISQGHKWRARYDRASECFHQALVMGDRHATEGLAALNGIGDIAYFQGRLDDAMAAYTEIRSVEGAAPRVRMRAAQSSGDVAISRGEIDAARAYLREAMVLVAELGAAGPGIAVRNSLAEAERAAGNFEVAQKLYKGAYRDLHRMGSPYTAIVDFNLAATDLGLGDIASARTRLERSLKLAETLPHARTALASGLAAMVAVEAHSGRPAAAAVHLDRLRETLSAGLIVPYDVPQLLQEAADTLERIGAEVSAEVRRLAVDVQERVASQ